MLHGGGVVAHINHRESVGSALVAHKKGITLCIITATLGILRHADKTTVAVLRTTSRDTLAHDSGFRVFPYMDHLCSGVGLLIVVGYGHRIELSDRFVALQHAGGIFPSDSGSGLHLSPGDFGSVTAAKTALRHEIIDTSLAILIAGIPILDSAVFHFRALLYDNLHDSCVKLVFIAHRGCATLKIAHISIIVGYNQGSLKLPRAGSVDSEICAQLHRAAHTFRNIYE